MSPNACLELKKSSVTFKNKTDVLPVTGGHLSELPTPCSTPRERTASALSVSSDDEEEVDTLTLNIRQVMITSLFRFQLKISKLWVVG
jgi:hypothetical protein